MSSSQSSQSYSYSSSSYTSSSSSSNNGTTHSSHSQSTHTSSSYNPSDGLTSQTVTQETGKPTLVETTHVPSSTTGGIAAGNSSQGRIEDVTTADEDKEAEQRYLEAMEEEYAKREGGA